MHDSVREIFPAFSVRCEGRVLWPYLDVKSLVTVGVGCLVPNLEVMLALPWRDVDGSRATPLQVTAQWEFLRKQSYLAKAGAHAAENATHLRLTDADADALLVSRMAQNETILAKTFDGWENYPADAQLGIHSMSWAMGAGFTKNYPHFRRAAEAGSWIEAADECTIGGESSNLGLVPRNVANRICFANAARVLANPVALRASETYWPLELK